MNSATLTFQYPDFSTELYNESPEMLPEIPTGSHGHSAVKSRKRMRRACIYGVCNNMQALGRVCGIPQYHRPQQSSMARSSNCVHRRTSKPTLWTMSLECPSQLQNGHSCQVPFPWTATPGHSQLQGAELCPRKQLSSSHVTHRGVA